MPTFVFRVSDEHMLQGLARFRESQEFLRRIMALKFFALIGLAALITILIVARTWGGVFFLSALLVLLIISPRFDGWRFRRNLRKSPFYMNEVKFVMSQDGCEICDPISSTTLKWPVFHKAIRFPDGFLLLIGTDQFYWLTIATLVEGSADEVNELIARAIGKYKVVQHRL
jgi:hypothetical protein